MWARVGPHVVVDVHVQFEVALALEHHVAHWAPGPEYVNGYYYYLYIFIKFIKIILEYLLRLYIPQQTYDIF